MEKSFNDKLAMAYDIASNLDYIVAFSMRKQRNNINNLFLKNDFLMQKFENFLDSLEDYDFKEYDYVRYSLSFDCYEVIKLASEFIDTLDEPFQSFFINSVKNSNVTFVNSYKGGKFRVNAQDGSLTIMSGIDYELSSVAYYIHELSHAVEFLIREENENIKPSNSLYNEVFERFMEFLVLDFLIEKGFREEEVFKFSNSFLEEEVFKIKALIVIRRKLIKSLKNNSIATFASLVECIPVNSLKNIHNNLDNFFNYRISYIIALEMYHVYEIDKEAAFSIFLEYFNLKNKSNEDIEEFFSYYIQKYEENNEDEIQKVRK